MNAREFEVIETRHFLILTEMGSNREFRIAASDGMLVGGLGVNNWRTGDVVRLSEDQQKRLAQLDARCREMGDEAAVREYKLQNRYGCVAWIIVVAAVIALIMLRDRLGWLVWFGIVAVVIAPVAILLIIFFLKKKGPGED